MPYLWAEEITDYQADNVANYNTILEVKRLNFFIGRNNAGKSRFLRHLLKFSQNFIEYAPHQIDLEKSQHEIIQSILSTKRQTLQSQSCIQSITSSSDSFESVEDLIQFIQDIFNNESAILPFKLHPKTAKLAQILDSLCFKGNRFTNEYKLNLNLFSFYSETETTDFTDKFYVPILRGMRPLHEDTTKHVYNLRNQKDYQIENPEHIITGEDLYDELQKRLLGEPEDRQLIEDYQKILSQYFFDNEPITLIPKIETDVVHIKIGNARQFPIYHLGDGLQQAILLTYDAFLRKDEIHAYFIEEPELHMHAGMVRQMMNFYLHETQHYYFFTTHSNHLLDMADESDEVMIQKFSKPTDEEGQTTFQINRCDRDRDLLQSLGVKPSSVYLANCTIWIEGITDRLYLLKYMERYLEDLKSKNPEKYAQYRRFMLHYHFAFVEYAGANMVHWSFENAVKLIDGAQDKGLSARAIASEMLLIADADIDKGQRIKTLNRELGADKFQLLEVKEIENTLPKALLLAVARNRFATMQTKTKTGFDIALLNEDTIDFNDSTNGIGRILDNAIRKPRTRIEKVCFAEKSGTIKRKLEFCHEIIKLMGEQQWELTDEAKKLVDTIFRHIAKNNA